MRPCPHKDTSATWRRVHLCHRIKDDWHDHRNVAESGIKMNSEMMVALGYLVFAGLINSAYTLPLKLKLKWKWENMWLAFTILGIWILPSLLGNADHSTVSGQFTDKSIIARCSSLHSAGLPGVSACCCRESRWTSSALPPCLPPSWESRQVLAPPCP